MSDYIQDLYQFELESGRLDFEADPGYRDAIRCFSRQYEELYLTGEHKQCEALYGLCFDLAHFSSRAAFSHGMRLGMALLCRGGTGLSGF